MVNSVQRSAFRLLFIPLLFLVSLSACNFSAGKNEDTETDLSPSIVYSRPQDGAAPVSFKADVEVYQSSNRSPNPPALTQKYRLAVKMIDGRINFRMDYPGSSFADGKARILVSDGLELRVIDAATMSVETRSDISAFDDNFGTSSLVPRTIATFAGRLDLDALQASYRSLSYDVQDVENGSGLTVAVPASSLGNFNNPGMTFRSAKLMFDTENSAYAGMEVVYTTEDNTVVKFTQCPVYEEKDGQLIKVGEVSVTDRDEPGFIDTTGSIIPRVDDSGSVPVITDEELKNLEESGATVIETPMLIGDPSNPDETITQTAVYESIEVDTLDDLYFRPVVR